MSTKHYSRSWLLFFCFLAFLILTAAISFQMFFVPKERPPSIKEKSSSFSTPDSVSQQPLEGENKEKFKGAGAVQGDIESAVRSDQFGNSLSGIFLKLRRFFSAQDSLNSERVKTPDEQMESSRAELLKWTATKRFGFQFGVVPATIEWKVKETKSSAVFLRAENQKNSSEMFFASVPKEPSKNYSEDLKEYFPLAKKMLGEVSKELPFRDLKIDDKQIKLFPNSKFGALKISGFYLPKRIHFKGTLYILQTRTHFVGAFGIGKERDFARLERMLNAMFQKISLLFQMQNPRTIKNMAQSEAVSQTVEEEIKTKLEIPRKNYKKIGGAEQKRKPWERIEEAPGTALNQTVPLPLELEEGFRVCKTCNGKGGCPNPGCDKGYILCEICKEHPPELCRKCKGTGLTRVENPFTRLETWAQCQRCLGTGKELCANKCIGGKSKCPICHGTGQCPECHGKGFSRR